MSGSGKPAPKPRKKSIVKPKAASSTKDEKTFKSAKFVQDSDDDEDNDGQASTGNYQALPVKNLARLSPEMKKIPAKPTPKPANRPKTHTPSPASGESRSDGEASNDRLSSTDKVKNNGLGTVERDVAAKRLSSIAEPSLKRKNPMVTASDTGSSVSDQDESSSPVPAKRQKGSARPKSGTSRAVHTTLSTKPSRHPASSDTDESGEPASNEDAETTSASEGGSESQSKNGGGEESTPASDEMTKYGRFAKNDIRDLAKSLQCRSKVSPATAPICTTSWLQVHYHLLTYRV